MLEQKDSFYGMAKKSITEATTTSPAQMYSQLIKQAFTNDWVFVGWERIVVLISVLWTVGSLIFFGWRFFT